MLVLIKNESIIKPKSYPTREVTAWWCSDTTISLRPVSNHFGMDGARNTVVQFSI